MNTSHVVKKEKLLSFSAVLSILVVLIHTQNTTLYAISPNGSWFDKLVFYLEQFISGDIAKIGVPAFFMFSGLLFYRDFNFSKYPQKMKSRFFSLIIPYLLWNLFRFALFYGFGKMAPENSFLYQMRVVFTSSNFWEGLLLYKYNLGYWFMYQLILYTLLCPLIYALLKKKPIAILSLLAVLVLFCTDALANLALNVFHNKFILIEGLFYYMLGAYVGLHHFDVVNMNTRLSRGLAVAGMLLGQLCFVLFHQTSILFFHIAFCTISAISFWYLFDIFGKKGLPLSVTTITFFIYSAHGTVLELCQQTIFAILPHTTVTALAEYLLLPVFTLILLVVVSRLLKRFTPKFWRLINGGR